MFKFFTPLALALSLPSLAFEPDSLPSTSKHKHLNSTHREAFKALKEQGQMAANIFPKKFIKSPNLTYDIYKKVITSSPLELPLSRLESGHTYYTKALPCKTGVYTYYSNTLNSVKSLLESDRFILEQAILHKNDHLNGTYEFHYAIDGNIDILEDTVFIVGHILLFYTSYSTLEGYIPKHLKDKETIEKSERYYTGLRRNLSTWVKGAGSRHELYGEETRFIRQQQSLPINFRSDSRESHASVDYSSAETGMSGEESNVSMLITQTLTLTGDPLSSTH